MRAIRSVLAFALLAGAAKADVIIKLDQATLGGTPGDTLAFKGIIYTTGIDEVFLNRDSLNLVGPNMSLVDLFFVNVPISLLGGQSSADIELFDVQLFAGSAGTWLGSYALFGGADGTATNPLASVNFTVEPAVPEPAVPSVLGGLLAAALALRVRPSAARIFRRRGV